MLAAAWLLIGAGGSALYGQIFVTEWNPGIIGKYDLSGAPIRTPLIAQFGAGPGGIAVDGDGYLYVPDWQSGTIGKYTASGALVNAQFLSGLRLPNDVAFDGKGNLYVACGNSIGQYTTSGATVNAQLISGLNSPVGITLDGNGHLFVADQLNSRIGEYTTSGATVNASLISGMGGPFGLTTDGSGYLFATFQGVSGSVVEFDATGQATTLISGLNQPTGIAWDGQGHLLVGDGDTISEYTTAGELVNPDFITGLPSISEILVVPEPSTLALCSLGIIALAILRPRRQQ